MSKVYYLRELRNVIFIIITRLVNDVAVILVNVK